MDGTRPIELKMLPLTAWRSRREVLCLARKLHRHPEGYYNVASPVIPKVDKLEDPDKVNAKYRKPEDHRIIAVFSGLYRVESGATYRQHLPWLMGWIHPELHGCIPERGMSDVFWGAQAECEHAMITKANLVILFLDYRKFFDAFEPEWVRKFAIALGLDTDLAEPAALHYKTSSALLKLATRTEIHSPPRTGSARKIPSRS